MKTVKVRKKVKIFLESVMKTVFYAKRAPLNSDVGSLTLPLGRIIIGLEIIYNRFNKFSV